MGFSLCFALAFTAGETVEPDSFAPRLIIQRSPEPLFSTASSGAPRGTHASCHGTSSRMGPSSRASNTMQHSSLTEAPASLVAASLPPAEAATLEIAPA